MTKRQFGAAGIKLLGVSYTLSGLISTVGLAALFVVPPMEGMPSASEMVLVNVLSVASVLVAAALCIFGGDVLAGRLLGEGTVVTHVSRRDLLWIGLSPIGVARH